MIKIGHGFDVHRLISENEFFLNYPNRKKPELIIGGIKIPHDKFLAGHSDADVLIHAIIDALLGASGNKDIGCQFPDNNKDFEAIDSSILLKKTMEILENSSYKIINIDCSILAEKPKLKDFIEPMKEKLSKIMEIEIDQINIKATSTERLGFIGREEGIAAEAVCLISSL